MKIPTAKSYRLEGPAKDHARTRVELRIEEDAEAVCVVFGPNDASLANVANALPDPSSLTSGALVIIPGQLFESPSIGARLRSLFSKPPTLATSDRCGALLARGYVEIGASHDPDMAWGFAPIAHRDERDGAEMTSAPDSF